MALIQCNKCGGQMSDKALRCPHCGTPNEPQDSLIQKSTPKKKTGFLIGLVAFIVVIVGGLAWWHLSSSKANAQDAVVEITPDFIKAVHQYDELYPFSEGLAVVKKDGKYGYIDTKGEAVIPVQFFGAGSFSEGKACVYDEQYNISFIDCEGEVVLKTPYQLAYSNYNQRGDNPNGVPNIYLNIVQPVEFINGICKIPVKTGSEGNWEYKYIDSKGEEVSEQAQTSPAANHKYTVFSKENDNGNALYGLKDAQGKAIIEPTYSYMSEPSNGVVNVTISSYRAFRNREEEFDAMDKGEPLLFTIYGYVNLDGVSTFTDSDYDRLEKFEGEQAQVKSIIASENAQRYMAENAEEYRKQQAQEIGWIYGTWTCHVVVNDPYLGRLEQNSKLVITNSNLQVYTDNKLTYNGSYSIEDGNIVYDQRNGSAMVIPINATSHCLEFGEGNYYTKSSTPSQIQSSHSQSSNYGSQNNQRRYRAPQPFHSELDVKRYLREHTFKYQNTVAKFGDKSVYLNGYAQTPPPRIVSFNNYDIVVVAGGTTFRIDALNGTMTDGKTVFVAP